MAAYRIIKTAADTICKGGVLVFPTETVYGIGANALDRKACEKVYRIKGRERSKALIVLVSDMNMLDRIAFVPKKYRKILEDVWPAPLTVILKARAAVPKRVTAGKGTVAVRMPDNATLLSIIRAAHVPIVAPSANPSGLTPARTGFEAKRYFDGKVDAIIDSGRKGCGVPSTIMRIPSMRVIRQGAFTEKQIKKAFGSR